MSEPLIRLLHAAYAAPADGVTDAELLARLVAVKDDAAFELLLRRHADLVWGVCRATAGQPADAEDAFQAAFLALATKATAVRGSVAGWLYRVAYHAALKAKQRQRRAGGVSPLFECPVGERKQEQGADAPRSPELDFAPVVHDELNRLPAKYREPLVLCYLEGFTQAEAAARLGLPVGTVATRVSRGGRRLRDRLVRRGLAPAAGGLAALAPSKASAELIAVVLHWKSVPPAAWPAAVASLSAGAVSAMSSVQPKLIAGLVACVAVAAGGVSLVAQGPGSPGAGGPPIPSRPAPPAAQPPLQPPQPDKLAVSADDRVATAAQRRRSMDNLKRILLAVHNYHDVNGRWPTGIKDEQGQLLLSWRVELLPYLEQEALFRRFKLDEPWDGPANKPLLAAMPEAYRVGIEPAGSTDTYYQTFAGVGTVCDQTVKMTLFEVTDGLSNTLAVAEVGPPVPWSKPADVPYSAKKPLPPLALPFKNVWTIATGDGAVRGLRPDIDPASLRQLVERADGAPIDIDKLHAPAVPLTAAERKEADLLMKEIADLRAEMSELVKQREVVRAELEAASPKAATGPDLIDLEGQKRALLAAVAKVREEIAALRAAVEEAKRKK
jgi:RNA polymerase sigma factor (sigma-70 family)